MVNFRRHFQANEGQERKQEQQHGFTKGDTYLTIVINFYGEMGFLASERRAVDIL